MIVIPNMEKPKSCYNHCDFIAMEEVGCPLKDYAESHQYKNAIHPDCPLIEIGDIEYQAYKEVRAMLLKKIEERILYGERSE